MIPCRETFQEEATFPGVSLRSTPRLNTDDALRATPHRGALTRKPLQGRVEARPIPALAARSPFQATLQLRESSLMPDPSDLSDRSDEN